MKHVSEASESGQGGRRTVSERLGFLSLEVLDESNRSRLSGIASVRFECESKHGNTLQVICKYKEDTGGSK